MYLLGEVFMTSKEKQSPAGYWLFVCLVLALGLPPVIGHFVMAPATAETVHAEANQ
jgi:hypothetical protein